MREAICPAPWMASVGALAVAACASINKMPTSAEFRAGAKNNPAAIYSKTETFTVPKPFNDVIALIKPQVERCLNTIHPGLPQQQVLPHRRAGQVTVTGPGQAEVLYYQPNIFILALADIEAAGGSTNITVMGNFTALVSRGLKSWTSGDPSCPIALETPFGGKYVRDVPSS